MRIFLDANILFSDAKSTGAIRSLLDLCLKHGHVLVADAYVIEEARRNLSVKFPKSLDDFESRVRQVETQRVRPMSNETETFGLPEKDIPVVKAALDLKCDVLVTGDKRHFGHLYGKKIGETLILSPAGLFEMESISPDA